MKTFAELELMDQLQQALAEEKYETPTPIQAQTIPPALQGRDVLGCAQTGTGKTAAFALPILNHLGSHNRKSQPNRPFALVLAPTRELAIQIGESFATYGKHLRLRQALIYGGVNQASQVRALRRGAHVVVATPGRLLDLMNQRHVSLDQLDVFVLDEADRMLDMGFLPDLTRIISQLPDERQSLFFSATMPPKITELSSQLLHDPVSVNVTPKRTSVEKIEQQLFFVEKKGKEGLLRKTLRQDEVERALVFTKTKRGANALAEKLLKSGIKAAAIHGNKSQNARQKALEAFRQKHVQVLVATDVAARGIDIDGITHVVNFDLPIEPENYVHRIGRTGRAGAAGIALSFCSGGERAELRAIEQLIGHAVPLAPNEVRPQDARGPKQGPRSGKKQSARPGKKPARRTRVDGEAVAERAAGENQYSVNPNGANQSGANQTGANQYGENQSGSKPYGPKKFGAKKFGAKKFGAKKFGAKKFSKTSANEQGGSENAGSKKPASKKQSTKKPQRPGSFVPKWKRDEAAGGENARPGKRRKFKSRPATAGSGNGQASQQRKRKKRDGQRLASAQSS